jgi:L-amino acid N-acyltransferase YncA
VITALGVLLAITTPSGVTTAAANTNSSAALSSALLRAGLRPGTQLTPVPTRPLHARAASDNLASLRVLQKSGFKIIGTEISFAPGRKSEIEETILRKD